MNNNSTSPVRTGGSFRVWANLSLRYKLILLFLAVTLLSVGTVAYLNIRNTSAALTAQANESMTTLAVVEARNFATILVRRVDSMQVFGQEEHIQEGVVTQNAAYSGGTEAILSELAQLDEQWVAAGDDDALVRERLNSELAHELENVKAVVPDFAEVFLTDRYGGLVATSDRTSDYYQADEGWWQAAYNDGQGAVYIGTPELDESTGVIGINMAVPVYDQDDEIIGILRTTLDATAAVNRLTALKLGETGGARLLLEGEVFVGQGKEPETFDDPATLAQLEIAPQGTIETSFDGRPNLIAYAAVSSPTDEQYISDLGWTVFVHQNREEALAAVAQQTRTTGMLALAIGVVAAVAAVVIGQTLANPIANLTKAVTQFTTGDMAARAERESNDEVGTLATSFNTMAEQVGGLLTTVQIRSAELEERTRELEASQSVTFAASERAAPDEMLGLVVDLVRDQFELYHAQVYLVDEEQQAAVLRQSTGYAGSQLLEKGHQIPLDATALVTRAIRTGEPVLVDDVNQAEDWLPNPLLPETQSELVVPLKVGDQVTGALDAQDMTPGRFSESTVALFQTMADQIAFLFENNELLERVTEQSETLTVFTTQLRTAAEIARQAGAVLDPEQLLQQTVDLMRSRFGLYHAHIYVLNETAGQLTIQAGSGEVGQVLREQGHAIPLDREKSLVARAARTQEPVLVDDTTLESDFMPNPLLPQTRSELSVPLVVGGKTLGVLDMQDDQAGRFAESDMDTYAVLAGQIAVALQNAALFEQTQIRLQVSQALAEAQTEDKVLDVMIGQADLYPEAQVTIITFDDETDERFSIVRRVDSLDSTLAPPFEAGARFPISKFPLEQHFSPNKPFVSANTLIDERLDPASQEVAKQTGAVSLAVVPITAGNEWLGLILAEAKQEAYFDERKLRLYHTLANQGATALQVARLHDETIELEARFRDVALSTSDWVWETDAQGRYTYCSDKVVDVLGHTAEEVLGKTPFDFMPEEEAARVGEIFGELVANKQPILDLENRNVTKDGREVYLLTSGTPILDEGGNLLGYRGVDKDITERKQAEVERERFTTQLRTAADLAERVNAILDPDELLNEVVTQLQGSFDLYHVHVYLLDEEQRDLVMQAGSGEVGQKMLQQGHSIPLDREKSLVARAARSREIVSVTDTTTAPDFMPNPLLPDTRSEVATPLVIGDRVLGVLDVQDNQTSRFTTSDLDIFTTLAGQIATALQNAGLFAAQQESEERFRSVVEHSQAGILILNDAYRFIYVNDEFCRITGYSQEELIGMDFRNILDEESVQLVADHYVRRQRGKDVPSRYEFVIVRKDGEKRDCEISSATFKDSAGNARSVGQLMDITERKKAEREIRESEEQFRVLVENAPEAIVVFDVETGRFMDVNENAVQLYGLKREELLEVGPIEVSPPTQPDGRPSAEAAMAYIQEAIEGGTPTFEWTHRNAANEDIPCELRLVRMPATDQTLIRGSITDITERKEAELERERFTTQLRTAADLAERINAILDPDELLNEVVTQLQGSFDLYHVHVYLLDEEQRDLVMQAGSGEVGQKMLQQGHSIPLDREKSLVARAARSREIVSVTDTTTAPDFMPNPLLPDTRSEVATPLVIGDRVLGVLDVQDNQTSRFTTSDLDIFTTLAGQIATALQNAGYVEQVETRLKVSRALADAQTEDEVLDALIQQMKVYPNTRASIFTVVPEAEEMTIAVRRQATPESDSLALLEEGMRLPISQFPSLQDSVEGKASVSSNLLTDETVDPAVREVARQTGALSQLSLPLMAGGEYMGVISVSSPEEGYFDERKLRLYETLAEQGMTALRTARLYDETQKAAEQVRQADQRKSEFIADMSHELRTPLNSISGYAELILMGIGGDIDPDTLEDIQAIYDNSQHLLRIINNLLDISKIEAGRMELEMEEVHIPSLFEEVKTSNAGLFVDQPVEMLIEVEDDLPPIQADRVRISQILNNLIGNSIKFTEEGSITLRGFADDEDGWVRIAVEDTGAGMSEEDLQKIFERFEQGESSLTRRAEVSGTGLGLSITRHLVEMHGGEIDVQSKPDEGSIFTVRLPIK